MTSEQFGVDSRYVPTEGAKRRAWSAGLRIVAIIAALNLILFVLTLVLNPRVDGPAGSSIVTTDLGVGAWRETLERLDLDVRQLRVPLADSELVGPAVAAGTRLVVLSPDEDRVDARYRRAVDDYLRAGGVVITTTRAASSLGIEASPAFDDAGLGVIPVHADLADVEALMVAGGSIGGDVTPLVTSEERGTLVATRDNVVLLADLRLVSNASLGFADNGVLAVRLSGTGTIYFDEYVHGFGVGQGLAGVPAATISLVLALVASIIWMWAMGSRFGPPQQRDRALPPPRAAYLDGIARSLARAKPTEAGYGVLRSRANSLLTRHAERYPGVGPAERRRRTAAAFDISDADFEALDHPIESPDQAISAAAIAAKIERARTGSAE